MGVVTAGAEIAVTLGDATTAIVDIGSTSTVDQSIEIGSATVTNSRVHRAQQFSGVINLNDAVGDHDTTLVSSLPAASV